MPVDKRIVDEQIGRLGVFDQWFTRKERNHLHEVMEPGETIHAMTSGLLDGNTWLVTVTNRRVLFLDKGMLFGLKQMELPLEHISAIGHKTGMVLGEITVSTAGGAKRIENIRKADVPKVAKILSCLLKEFRQSVADGNREADTGDDTVSKLERLAALKDKGLLSDEEFAAQKSKLLSQG